MCRAFHTAKEQSFFGKNYLSLKYWLAFFVQAPRQLLKMWVWNTGVELESWEVA